MSGPSISNIPSLLTGFLETIYHVTIGSYLTVGTSASISGNLAVTGGITASSLTTTGSVAASCGISGSSLTVTGGIAASSGISGSSLTLTAGADISSALTVSGSASLLGDITLGSNSSDQTVSNGQWITQPNMIAVHAYNSTLRTNVLGNSTFYTVVFDTERADRSAAFNSSTTLTIQKTGLYDWAGSVSMTGLTSAHGNTKIQIISSNITLTPSFLNGALGGAAGPTGDLTLAFVAMSVPHTSGETVTVRVQIVGGSTTVDVYGDATGADTFFGCHFVG